MNELPIIVPHAAQSEMLPAIKIAMSQEGRIPKYALMDGDECYHDLIRNLWHRAETPFIINEHDVIAWPGAIPQLEACEHPWCTFLYRAPCGWLRNGLGLVKFDPKRLPNIFAQLFSKRHWAGLDMQIARRLEALGFNAHVHMPAVTNLNSLVWGVPHRADTLPI